MSFTVIVLCALSLTATAKNADFCFHQHVTGNNTVHRGLTGTFHAEGAVAAVPEASKKMGKFRTESDVIDVRALTGGCPLTKDLPDKATCESITPNGGTKAPGLFSMVDFRSTAQTQVVYSTLAQAYGVTCLNGPRKIYMDAHANDLQLVVMAMWSKYEDLISYPTEWTYDGPPTSQKFTYDCGSIYAVNEHRASGIFFPQSSSWSANHKCSYCAVMVCCTSPIQTYWPAGTNVPQKGSCVIFDGNHNEVYRTTGGLSSTTQRYCRVIEGSEACHGTIISEWGARAYGGNVFCVTKRRSSTRSMILAGDAATIRKLQSLDYVNKPPHSVHGISLMVAADVKSVLTALAYPVEKCVFDGGSWTKGWTTEEREEGLRGDCPIRSNMSALMIPTGGTANAGFAQNEMVRNEETTRFLGAILAGLIGLIVGGIGVFFALHSSGNTKQLLAVDQQRVYAVEELRAKVEKEFNDLRESDRELVAAIRGQEVALEIVRAQSLARDLEIVSVLYNTQIYENNKQQMDKLVTQMLGSEGKSPFVQISPNCFNLKEKYRCDEDCFANMTSMVEEHVVRGARPDETIELMSNHLTEVEPEYNGFFDAKGIVLTVCLVMVVLAFGIVFILTMRMANRGNL